MDIQAIKAELYDLQFHNCNGRFTMPGPDGKRDPDDCSCSYCDRVLKLQRMLAEDVRIVPALSARELFDGAGKTNMLEGRSLRLNVPEGE